MNFKIYHNKVKINEADCFDLLINELSALRTLGYTNITFYHHQEEDVEINNQPAEQCGRQTGYMMFDTYGCWYEIKPNNGTDNFWMIGNYPYDY